MGRRAPGAKTDILVIEGGGLASAALRLCLLLLLLSSGLGLLRTTRACARACVCICPSGRAYGPWAPGAKTDILVIEGGGLASAALRRASSSFSFERPRPSTNHARVCARACACICPSGRAYGPSGAGSQDGHFGYRRRGACLGCLALCLLLLLDSSGLGHLRTTCACARARVHMPKWPCLWAVGRREPRRTFWL